MAAGWLCLGPRAEARWVERFREAGHVVHWQDGLPSLQDLQGIEIVVDAHPEGDRKREVLRAVGTIASWDGPVAVLLEESSATWWAAQSGLGERLVGFRLCPSPEHFRSLELFRGELGGAESLCAIQGSFEKLGIPMVVCKDQAGGILPRALAAMINEAAYMVLYGIATPMEIDKMMRLGANFPLGPLEMADQIGLDRVMATLEALCREMGPQYQPCPWLRRKVEAGLLGAKTGGGFYHLDGREML